MIEYLKYKLRWMKIFFSPFKSPKIRFYFGPIAIGTPYFYPRYWRRNKNGSGQVAKQAKLFKIDIVPLGYKTKWEDHNYCHEWNPVWSIVVLGSQTAISFELDSQVWESYLVYENCTEGVTLNRLRKCRKLNPNIWTGSNGSTDYFLKGLKDKYKTI